jgi:hypothetical protein
MLTGDNAPPRRRSRAVSALPKSRPKPDRKGAARNSPRVSRGRHGWRRVIDALASADVGIGMGTGTDVQSKVRVTLLGAISPAWRACRLSAATMSNIRQNLFFAFVYNAAGVPIAAGVLYPTFGILLSPIIAAAAMSLSSVSVVANALRLRHTPL